MGTQTASGIIRSAKSFLLILVDVSNIITMIIAGYTEYNVAVRIGLKTV